MHLDGARLWNASIATGIPLNKYCELFDTVSLCLSKGLGAPVGSLLVGTKDTVHRARHFRKLFGGGWRQAGILAAAGLYAIEHQWPKLKTDHDNAQLLASLLGAIPGVKIVNKVETNMVFLNLDASLRSQGVNWNALVRRVRSSHGFILGEQGSITAPVRFVVHLQTSKENIELLAVALKEAIASEIALAAGKAAA